MQLLPGLTPELAKQIGQAARRRILAQHTYAHRAAQVHRLLAGDTESVASPSRPVEVGPRAALK
jgi:hypothetical protein